MKKAAWTQRKPIEYVTLKSNFHTRLVISGERTPSGTRYDFQPGEMNEVLARDKKYLLSLVYQQSNCCGGQVPQPIKYFVEVKL